MKSFLIAISCVFLLTGCLRSTPTNFYILESGAPPVNMDSLPGRTLRVAQVEAPSYLNRNNIVSRVHGQTKLILAEFHLWAEPLSGGVRRVIAESISGPLLKSGIAVLPPTSESGGDFTLLLDLRRLDGNFNENAVLECHWSLLDRNEKPLERGIFSKEKMVNGADYNILVAVESDLLREFGDYLSNRLAGILAAKK